MASPPTLPGWQIADTPMLRINPTAGRRLSDARLRSAVATLVSAEHDCRAVRDSACAELFALAGSASGSQRSRLLRLKRAVYNGRAPQSSDWLDPLPPAVAAWQAARERGDLACTTIETGYDVFLAAERTQLADLLADDSLLQSLALVSPEVYDAAQRYRRSRGATARDRKSERGLVQHLARAMTRVSPLSRYTAFGIGSWDADGVGLDGVRFDRRTARSVVSLDQAMLLDIVSGVATGPSARADATVRLNPRLRVDGERIRFVQVVDGARRAVATQATPSVLALMRLVAMGPVGAGSLVAPLAGALRIGDTAATAIVRAAIDAEILVSGPVYPEQTPDGLVAAARHLAAVAPDAAAAADAIGAALTAAERGTVIERVAALTRIRTAETQLNACSTQPGQLRVNEDYLLPAQVVSPCGYSQALHDLGAVAGMANLFDRHHEMRGLLLRAFLDSFGAGASVRLVDHAADLAAEVRLRAQRLDADNAIELGPRDDSLGELLRQRVLVNSDLTDRIVAAGADGVEELQIDPRWLASWADLVPSRYAAAPASYALLAQPSEGRLVVNGCYPGHGQLLARFVGRCDDQSGARIRRRIERLYSTDGYRLREDHGLHGNNLNHRPALFDDVLDAHSWLQVELRHDPDRDCLDLVDGDGVTIRVVSLGMKWIEAQPAPLLIAVWLYGPSMVAYDPLHRACAAQVGARASAGTGGATIVLPRLSAGDVVLHRRRWYPGPDLAAAFEESAGRSDLLAVTRWRAEHGVPEEVFIKTPLWRLSTGRDATADAIRQYVLDHRREKPQYVDLTSALMVRVLPKLMERRQSGFVEEARPAVRPGVHAREWAIDLDQVR